MTVTFFYYDSIMIEYDRHPEDLSLLLFSTSESMDEKGGLNPGIDVVATVLPLINFKEVKIEKSRTELTMEKKSVLPGEDSLYQLGFRVNEQADFEKISDAFNRLVEMVKIYRIKQNQK